MDDAFEIEFTGGEELERALRAIPEKLAERVTRIALRNAANYMAREIRGSAPKKTGRLRKAIRVKTSSINRLQRNGTVGMYITVYPGKSRKDPKGAWYGKFVEVGYNRGSKAVSHRLSIKEAEALHQRKKAQGLRYRDNRMQTRIMIRTGGEKVEGRHFVQSTFRRTGEQAARLAQTGIEQAIKQTAHQLGFREQ